MAHFNVVVFAKESDVAKLMEQYDENLETDWWDNGLVTCKEVENFIDYYMGQGYNVNHENLEPFYKFHGSDYDNDKWVFDSYGIHRMSNYNPYGKWDYYDVIGNRLPNWTPYAFVTPEGVWVGRDISSDNGRKYEEIPLDEWEVIYRKAVQMYKKCSKTVLDCHC